MDIRYLLWIIDLCTNKNIIPRRPAMSELSIAPYFPFRRIKITQQYISADVSIAQIVSEPDKRFHPICHRCKEKASVIHSHAQRKIRDLDFGGLRVWIQSHYRKIIWSSLSAHTCRGFGAISSFCTRDKPNGSLYL